MRTIRMLAFVLVLSGISTSGYGQSFATAAPVPNLVNFAGTLKDSGGHAIQSITGVTFSLYAQEEGGAPLWLETQNVQADGKGNYTVRLGATKAEGMPLELFTSNTARWLGVRMNGGEEQPRVLLVSVPYALKAADAETIGGLPPSAFVLATPHSGAGNATSSTSTSKNGVSPSLSGTGTTNYLPRWTSTTALGTSALFQTGSGSSAKIGINTNTPAAMLDVKGSVTIRSLLNLPAVANATASAGADSNQIGFVSSAFNSSSHAATNQVFRWLAEPTGNNTTSPAATLNLLFGVAPSAPSETGLKINSKGVFTFASGQTFPGTGTISAVVAESGLLGGGTSGTVGLAVDSSQIPYLGIANDFSDTQSTFSSAGVGFFGQSASSYGVYGLSSSNYGVVGVTTSGNGVYGQVSADTQAGVIGRQENSSGNWAIYAFGNLGATGTKSSVVPVDNGTRQVALYAVESPGVWFEDYGSGKLVSGVATIKIDPVYAQTVNTGVEYHVFLTPNGDCEGLYAATKTATGFEVRELRHGTSNVTFDYRIIALRRGYETKRMADVTSGTPRANIETPRMGNARPAVRTPTVK